MYVGEAVVFSKLCIMENFIFIQHYTMNRHISSPGPALVWSGPLPGPAAGSVCSDNGRGLGLPSRGGIISIVLPSPFVRLTPFVLKQISDIALFQL